MNDSTLLYWRNGSGYEPTEVLQRYGMFIFDWAHGAKMWINEYTPMDNGAVLAEQCRQLKLVNPNAKCLVYRNTVKAMNQFVDVSTLADDPVYEGFFLPWKPGATQSGACNIRTHGGQPLMPNPQIECHNLTSTDVHVPMCDGANKSKCSKRLYFGTHQIPMVPSNNWAANTSFPFQNLSCVGQCNCGRLPCGEYLFDFRNASMREWFVKSYMDGSMSPAYVDGLVLDDSWTSKAPSEEDQHCLDDIGLSQADVQDITTGWQAAVDALAVHAAARRAYIAPGYGGDSLSRRVANSSAQCVKRMRYFCGVGARPTPPHFFSVAYDEVPPPVFGLTPTNVDLDMAHFLLARGEYGWVGAGPLLGWKLSHWWAPGQSRLIEPLDFRPHWFDADFGEPLSQCRETAAGVSGIFVREYTKANATVDCLRIAGSISLGTYK
jgi:hypothetical protein